MRHLPPSECARQGLANAVICTLPCARSVNYLVGRFTPSWEQRLMRTGQRRLEILRQLFLTGYVEAKELALTLDVDSSTIRRDLEALARGGRLQRTHGGACVNAGAVDVPYAMKQQERMFAKDAIASAACEVVRDGDSVLLDSGSTTYQLAIALRTRNDLTIVTND